jgi:hypothetical protein
MLILGIPVRSEQYCSNPMMITSPETPRNRLLVPALLAGLIWLCFYRLSGGFGFYDDDLHFFGIVTNYESPGELWGWIKYCWMKWPQGRPMGYTAMYSLAYLGDWLGGLAGYQLLSMLLAWVNSLLFYRLVARHVNARAALPAVLFFSLAAISTVQLAFTFAFYYSVAVFFFLVAANLYPTRWRALSYLFLALAMLSQEPITLAFLFFPLLILPLNKQGVMTWIKHAACWLLVIGTILAIRWKIGDPWGSNRVADIAGSPVATLTRSLESTVNGFGTHWKLIFLRPIQAFENLTLAGSLAFAVAAVIVRTLLHWNTTAKPARDAIAPPVDHSLVRMAVVGLLCMSVPYAAYFRDYWYPCTAETGFFSAVHIITMFGSALVVGAIWNVLINLPALRLYATVAASIYFASLVLFGQVLQKDLAMNWSGQKEFWRELYRLCPDLTDGTDVLVLNKNLPTRRFASQFSWPDELTLGRQYRFPTEWKRAPRAFFVNSDIAGHHVYLENGQFKWSFHPSILNHAKAGKEIIEPGTVIILAKSQLGYERLFGSFPVKNGQLTLKTLGPSALPGMPRRQFAALFDIPSPVATPAPNPSP